MCYRRPRPCASAGVNSSRRGRWRWAVAAPKFGLMDHDSTENPKTSPKTSGPAKPPRGSEPDLPPNDLAADVDPATSIPEEDEEARLPEVPEEPAAAVAEGPLAVGHAAIENAVRLAPISPGVYRMLNAASDVLYVGKAKNVRKRLASYARVSAPQPARILRMIAATVTVEIVSTSTETEALLLEANLIKQLRPRFNVQLRDDKSFPYILITGDHWAPQILKHRGAQTRPGRYFGPFASAGAVNRTSQNWGNRAYFPRAEKSFTPEEVLASFLAQFYDDKPPPKLILLSHEIEECELLADALSVKAGSKVEVSVPKRGEKKELIAHALTNAREALGRKLADTATQSRLLQGLVTTLGLPHPPKRIEVYDNSHIQGTNAVGAMIVAGPDGFIKNQYRKFNIKSEGLTPGDDYAMMREVLQRRFKRLLAPAEGDPAKAKADTKTDDDSFPQWPDLVIIDGGRCQLNAVREIFEELGLGQVSLLAVAKGPERDAGRETLFMPDREAIKLEPRDPVLYFIQRLRDEAHRFVIGSHRKLRKKDIREAGLQEIPGIGPSRKRALLHHFGTLKEIERASIADLGKVPGVSAESARKIFEFFHPQPG